MTSPKPSRTALVRWAGIALVILLNAAHLKAYADGKDDPWQFVIFLLSLAALPFLTRSRGLENPVAINTTPTGHGDGPRGFELLPSSKAYPAWRPGRAQEIIAVIAVVGLGFFLRLWMWDSVPVGIWSDELLAAANGVRVLEGAPASPFGTLPLVPGWPTWVHTFNLYTYYVAASLKVFGVGHLGIKSLSLVPGCLTVLGFYWLLRELGGPRLAVIGTLVLDLSRWHLTHSRFEWDSTFMVMGAVFGMAAIVRGMRTGRHHWMALGGIAMGLIQFSYLASRLAAVGSVMWLATLFIVGQRQAPGFRKRLFVGGLAWALAFSVAAGPIMTFHFTNEEIAKARIKQVSIDKEENPSADKSLGENIDLYLGMFRKEGPANPRQNIPKARLLPEAVAILAGLGGLLALALRRGVGGAMSWAFFVSGLAGGVLSENHGSPNAHRVGLVIPMVYLWVALALEQLAAAVGQEISRIRRLKDVIKTRWAPALIAAGMAALIFTPGINDTYRYFNKFATSKSHWRGVRAAEHLRLAQFLERYQTSHTIWVDLMFDDLTLDIILWTPPEGEGEERVGGLSRPRWSLVPISSQRLLPEPTSDRPVVLAVKKENREILSQRYPDLPWQIHKDPWKREMFATVELTAEEIKSMRAAFKQQASRGKGEYLFTREDLKGKGLVRLVYAREDNRKLISAFVDRPKKLSRMPSGPILRQTSRMEWHGWLKISEPGTYTFAEPEKGTKGELWIDGEKLKMGKKGPATVELTQGDHSFLFKTRLNVYRRLTLLWQPPGASELEPIPGDVVAPRLPRGYKNNPHKAQKDKTRGDEAPGE